MPAYTDTCYINPFLFGDTLNQQKAGEPENPQCPRIAQHESGESCRRNLAAINDSLTLQKNLYRHKILKHFGCPFETTLGRRDKKKC